MKTPKNQKELLQIIEEQQKMLRTMKQAMGRLEQKIFNLNKLTNRTNNDNRRLTERVNALQQKILRG